MPILLTCECGKKLRVADEPAGKRVRCPQCKATLQVPAADTPQDDAPPPKKNRPAPLDEEDDDTPPAKASKKRPRDEEEEDAPPAKASKKKPRDEEEEDEDRPRKSKARSENGQKPMKSRKGKQGSSNKVLLAVCLGVTMLLLGAGLVSWLVLGSASTQNQGGGDKKNPASPGTTPGGPVMVVSTDQLAREWIADNNAAFQKYKSKTIEIEANAFDFRIHNDRIWLLLETSVKKDTETLIVACKMKNPEFYKTILPPMKVKIRGNYSADYYLIGPNLQDVEIIEGGQGKGIRELTAVQLAEEIDALPKEADNKRLGWALMTGEIDGKAKGLFSSILLLKGSAKTKVAVEVGMGAAVEKKVSEVAIGQSVRCVANLWVMRDRFRNNAVDVKIGTLLDP